MEFNREQDLFRKSGVNLKKLQKNLIQTFLKQAVRDDIFHGRHAPRKFICSPDRYIIPVDFGIMGRLDKNNRKYLAEILYGFIKKRLCKKLQKFILRQV